MYRISSNSTFSTLYHIPSDSTSIGNIRDIENNTEIKNYTYAEQYSLNELYRFRTTIESLQLEYESNVNKDISDKGTEICIPHVSKDGDGCKTIIQLSSAIEQYRCELLFTGDVNEQQRAMQHNGTIPQPDGAIDSHNCSILSEEFITEPLNSAEEDFPIAFSMLMYKDAQQARRLLRAIYRPHNFYCIHVDENALAEVYSSMRKLSKCFKNIIVSSTRYDVRWGTFSIVQSEIQCMKDLINYYWKYFINLTGQEFPLKTNWQLVQILQAFRGGNDVEGSFKKAWRYSKRYRVEWNHTRYHIGATEIEKPIPPYNIRIAIGSTHIAVSRGYVNFLLFSKVASEFLEWLNGTQIPDEMLFASLNHNPHLHVPGSYKGYQDIDRYGHLGTMHQSIDKRLMGTDVARFKVHCHDSNCVLYKTV